jgi:hypothetical protein
MRRLRIVGLALLALGVPAFAFGGEQEASGEGLAVSASLNGCGLANETIVCRIDASWTAPEGSEYFTISVTRANGSVVDLGQSSGTSRSIFVPYVGPGTYSVQIAAWGVPPGEDEPQVLARESSMSTAGDEGGTISALPETGTRSDTAPEASPADEGPAGQQNPLPEPPAPEPPAPPACDEEPPPEEAPEEPGDPAAGAAVAEEAAVTVAAEAEAEDDPAAPPCP